MALHGLSGWSETAASEAADESGTSSAPSVNIARDPFADRLVVVEVFPRLANGEPRMIGFANLPYTTPPNDQTKIYTGTVTTTAGAHYLVDSAATFATEGVARGDYVEVYDTADPPVFRGSAQVVSVVSETVLYTDGLSGGTGNTFASTNTYTVYPRNRSYRQVLVQPFSVAGDLFRGENIGATTSFTRGAIKLRVTDGTLDRELSELSWAGAQCRVYFGNPAADPERQDLFEVAAGTIAGISFNTIDATLNWRDRTVDLSERTLQENTYAGYGRAAILDGTADQWEMTSTYLPATPHPTGNFTYLICCAQLGHSAVQILGSTKNSVVSTTDAGWTLHTNAGNSSFIFRLGDGTNGEVRTAQGDDFPGNVWTDNDYHTFALIVDRERDLAHLGLDGAYVDANYDISSVTGSMEGNKWIQMGNSGSYPMDHHVAWAAVYPWALGEDELRDATNIGVQNGDVNLELGWPFEEGTGTAIANRAGGLWSKGVLFGGTTSDYGSISSSTDFDISGSTSYAIRISFSSTETVAANLFTRWDGSTGWYINLNFGLSYTRLNCVIDDGPNLVQLINDSDLQITSGEKHTLYVQGRFTGTTREYEMWLDGNLVDSATSAAIGDVAPSSTDIQVAYWGNPTEATVYDTAHWIGRALTEEEMWGSSDTPWQKHVQIPVDAQPDLLEGLVFAHRWDEGGTETTVEDWSGNNHDITLNGTTNWATGDGALTTDDWAASGEGGLDLKGKFKPTHYGRVRQVPPVLVDYADQVYQYSDAGGSVTNLYEGGVASWTLDSTTTDRATFYNKTLTFSEYIVDSSRGMVRFGATPSKEIAVDLSSNQSSAQVTEVVNDIVTQSGGVASADVDSDSLTDLRDELRQDFATENANPIYRAQAGVWAGVERKSVAGALTEVLQGVNGFWYFDASGRFKVGRVPVPEEASISRVIDQDNIELATYRSRPATEPSWRNVILYDRYYQVLRQSDLASGTGNQEEFLREYRSLDAPPNEELLEAHPLAKDSEWPSLLVNRSAARVQLARNVKLFGRPRRIVEFDAKRALFQYQLGDAVLLQSDRYASSCDYGVSAYLSSTSDRWYYADDAAGKSSAWGDGWTAITRITIDSSSMIGSRWVVGRWEQFQLWLDPSGRPGTFAWDSDGTRYQGYAVRPIPLDTEVLLCASYNPTTNGWVFVVDGNEVDFETRSVSDAAGTTYELEIGYTEDAVLQSAHQKFDGYIHEVQVWESSMSAAEMVYWASCDLSRYESSLERLNLYVPVRTSYLDSGGSEVPLSDRDGWARDFGPNGFTPTTANWSINENLLTPGKPYVVLGKDESIGGDRVKLKLWG